MQRRELGRSGLQVPAVAFGGWAIGGWTWGGSDNARSIEAIRAGIEAGMDAVDTAPVYGFGRSERVVGEAIAGLRGRVTVMTKAGLRWDEPRGRHFFDTTDAEGRTVSVHRNSRPDSLRAEVEQSLARLGIEAIDLLQIHWPDPTTPLAESMGALLDLRGEGKLRAIGVSNFTAEELEECQRALGEVPLASTQERYSLLARGIELDPLPWAREHRVGVLAYSPLEQGLLTGRVGPERRFAEGDQRSGKATFSAENRARINATLERAALPIAERRGATLAQVAIAWTLAQPGVTCALVGARTPEQARENAAAGDVRLDPPEVEELGRAFAELRLAAGGGLLKRVLRRLAGG